MIGFDLTDEQRDFRDLAHRFAEKTIRPVAAEADESEELPWDVLEQAHKTGLLSYQIPEEYGGGGVESLLTRVLVNEELHWGCAGIGSTLGGVDLCVVPIMISGTEAQQAKYLPRFCDPSKVTLGAFAITEPMAGSDAGGITTLAKRNGDKYILNGTKTFITNAGVADLYVVFVTMDPSAGTDAITAFVVEKGWPGLSFGAKEKKLGIRCSQTANVILENVEVPVENRLGEEGEGFGIAMRTFDITRTHIAAGGVGIARAAYEYALQYAQERKQFNRPIARFQAVAFMLADMATQIDAARFLVWHAAWRYDQGKKFTKEASMAKAFAGDIAAKVTTDAVQILGGYGYIRDYPVEKWMRDAKIMQIYEGTAQIQRLIIARQLATES